MLRSSRCRRPATLVPGFAGAGLRDRRASAIRPREGEGFLEKTAVRRSSKVRELSKGMVAQLHLALVMAIDAPLLVLDEPTLGLDISYRKQFYDSLLSDYLDRSRTIVLTTHHVEEIQHVITDLAFINAGRIVLSCTMEEFDSRYRNSRSIPAIFPPHASSSRCTSGRSSAATFCSSTVWTLPFSPPREVRTPALRTCSWP